MRLILLGGPGAGKGTQAKLISEKYHIPQISTGEIFRQAIKDETHLGKKVKAIVEGGGYVSDDIVIALVEERLKQKDCQHGFLLDGFPRTIPQVKALHEMTSIDYVIDIDVPEEEIVQRLSGRRIHPASGRIYHTLNNPPHTPNHDDQTGEALIQRPDDAEITVRKRLSVYENQTRPLRNYYQEHKGGGAGEQQHHARYVKINGVGSVDEISNKIFAVLDKHKETIQ